MRKDTIRRAVQEAAVASGAIGGCLRGRRPWQKCEVLTHDILWLVTVESAHVKESGCSAVEDYVSLIAVDVAFYELTAVSRMGNDGVGRAGNTC